MRRRADPPDPAGSSEFVIEESLGYLLNRAARKMAHQLALEIEPAGIAIGQWAILLGYLALPWVVLAARRLRADPRQGWPEAVVAVAVAAVCSPSSGVMVPTRSVLRMLQDRRFANLREWTHGVDTDLFAFSPAPRSSSLTALNTI